MARYLTESQAAADGFHIVHEPEEHRFAVYARSADHGAADGPGRLVGEAHYSLRGDASAAPGAAPASDSSAGTIDFDHTVVHPDFRGTGLSGLLAHRAVSDDIVHGRRVLASCWFIEGYLARHPELVTPGA